MPPASAQTLLGRDTPVTFVDVRPLDQFARDTMAPVLKPMGFKRQGARFRHDVGDGLLTYVDVTSYRLSNAYDVEFHCNLAVIVDTYRDWIYRWGNKRPAPTEADGLFRSRVHQPLGSDHWQLKFDDEKAQQHFANMLRAAAQDLLNLASVDALLAVARRQPFHPSLWAGPGVAEAVLELKRGNYDRVREMLPYLAENDVSGDFVPWLLARLETGERVEQA